MKCTQVCCTLYSLCYDGKGKPVFLNIIFLVTLYEKLNELGEKKQSLIDELEKENKGTPAEERERLLKQVTPNRDQHLISPYSHRYIPKQLQVGKEIIENLSTTRGVLCSCATRFLNVKRSSRV